MAYNTITATCCALHHTLHFHREKMFFYQRLFNERPRPAAERRPDDDTAAERFYNRMFNIHFQAYHEVEMLITEYGDLPEASFLPLPVPEAAGSTIPKGDVPGKL